MYESLPAGARPDKIFMTNTSEYEITMPPKEISILTKEEMAFFVERDTGEPFQIGAYAVDEAGNIFRVDGFSFYVGKKDAINAMLVWTRSDGHNTTSSVYTCHHISGELIYELVQCTDDCLAGIRDVLGYNMKDLSISYVDIGNIFRFINPEHGELDFQDVTEFLVKKLVGYKGIKDWESQH